LVKMRPNEDTCVEDFSPKWFQELVECNVWLIEGHFTVKNAVRSIKARGCSLSKRVYGF
jgi:hypothetical protein